MQNLIDTETPNPSRFARTPDGKIDFDAYVGLEALYYADEHLVFKVRVTGARQRFGHLDLEVTPVEGAGARWVEFKNLELLNDPAKSAVTVAPVVEVTPAVEAVVPPEQYVATEPVESTGTHWTERRPAPVAVATEVVETTTTDMETQVGNILNEDSPVIK